MKVEENASVASIRSRIKKVDDARAQERFRRRLLRLTREGSEDLELVFNEKYWEGRKGQETLFLEFKDGRNLSYTDIAREVGISPEGVKRRLQVVRREGLEVDVLLDNKFWTDRRGRPQPKKKIKPKKVYVRQKPLVDLRKIPGAPSQLEREMERKGFLRR